MVPTRAPLSCSLSRMQLQNLQPRQSLSKNTRTIHLWHAFYNALSDVSKRQPAIDGSIFRITLTPSKRISHGALEVDLWNKRKTEGESDACRWNILYLAAYVSRNSSENSKNRKERYIFPRNVSKILVISIINNWWETRGICPSRRVTRVIFNSLLFSPPRNC